jgi:hypothetical protein
MIIIKTQYKNIKFFPEIEFFWSLDALNFSKLPHLSPQDIPKLQSVEGLFYGQHDRRIFKDEENSDSGKSNIDQAMLDPNNLASLIESANKQNNLKEIHRVTETVQRITRECLIVPKNCFKLKTGSFLEKLKYFKINLQENKENEQEEEEEEKKKSNSFRNVSKSNNSKFQKVQNSFSFFQKPTNRQINKFLALKDSKDFRKYFKIDYFPSIRDTYYLGKFLTPLKPKEFN